MGPTEHARGRTISKIPAEPVCRVNVKPLVIDAKENSMLTDRNRGRTCRRISASTRFDERMHLSMGDAAANDEYSDRVECSR
jgi:hypothetical protein